MHLFNMIMARPVLTELSLDLQIYICEFLHPVHILALRQVNSYAKCFIHHSLKQMHIDLQGLSSSHFTTDRMDSCSTSHMSPPFTLSPDFPYSCYVCFRTRTCCYFSKAMDRVVIFEEEQKSRWAFIES